MTRRARTRSRSAAGRRRRTPGRAAGRRRIRAGRGSARRGFLAVGLTGGIASGKDLVAGYLEREGIPVLDADRIGHELIEPGAACYRPLLARFGRGVLGRAGRIDRRRLGAIVFSDAAARRALNALLHPPILREAERRLRRLHERRGHPIAAVSAALLVEAGAARRFDRVVLVACRPRVRIRRLMRRDGLSLAEARVRVRAQASDAARRRGAHFVIDNSGRRRQTRARVRRVAEALWRLVGNRRPPRQKTIKA